MKLNLLNPKQVTQAAANATFGRLNDGGGLALLCNYKGKPGAPSLIHRWVYRGTVGGKVFEMGLGTLAEVSLATARDAADTARKLVGQGIDPRKEKRDEQAAERQAVQALAQAAEDARRIAEGEAVENSVKDWVLRYVAKQESGWASVKTKEGWIGNAQQIARKVYGGQMGKYVFDVIGNKNIREVTRDEITKLLTASMEAAAAHTAGGSGTETMHRLRKKLHSVFEFAMHAKYLAINECEGQDKQVAKKRSGNFPAVDTAEALRGVLLAFDNCEAREITKIAMQVQAYMFQRSNISVGMQWAHVDLPNAMWAVPWEFMKDTLENKEAAAKAGKLHRLPLPRQVVKLLERAKELTGGGVYVFPHEDDATRPMPVATLNDAMQRAMGKRKGTPWISYQVAHGFRALGISFGQKYCNIDKPVLDIIAGHVIGDNLGTAYERNQWEEERPYALQDYADWLDAVKAGDADAMLTHGQRIRAKASRAEAANAPTMSAADWAEFQQWQAARRAAMAQQAA